MLDTGKFQTGFKKGSMTHFNLTKVMTSILNTRRKRNDRVGYMFIDFRKAYDTVRRDQLFGMLLKRCSTDEERSILSLILDLFYENEVQYGKTSI